MAKHNDEAVHELAALIYQGLFADSSRGCSAEHCPGLARESLVAAAVFFETIDKVAEEKVAAEKAEAEKAAAQKRAETEEAAAQKRAEAEEAAAQKTPARAHR